MPIEKPRQTWMMKKGAETPVRTRMLSQRQEQLPPLRDIFSIGVLSSGRLLPPSVRHFEPQMISRKLYWRGRLANGTSFKLHFCQQRFHWFPPFCEYYRDIRGIIYVSYAMERTLTAPLSVILKAAHPKKQSVSPLCLLEAETCHVSCGCCTYFNDPILHKNEENLWTAFPQYPPIYPPCSESLRICHILLFSLDSSAALCCA